MVWGYASTPTKDLDGEIIELDAIRAALPDYMKWANIREMHQPSAVGVAKEASVDQKGLWLGAKITGGEAWQKVLDEVYKGFSIGGIVTRQEDNVISGLELIEISLVDRPANPDCRIEMVKGARVAASGEAFLVSITDSTVEPVLDPMERSFVERIFAKLGLSKGGDGLSPPAGSGGKKPEDNNPFVSHEIEEVADSKDGDYGDVHYADPGYQKDKKKRYPVDTEEHIRAAWSYIHMPKNAEHYSEEDLGKVRANITAAWRAKVDPDGPPAAQKVADVTPLHKGMDAVLEGSIAFQSLRRMQRYLLNESFVERDPVDAERSLEAATLAAQLATLVSQIAEDEGGEALTMTDIDDLRYGAFDQPIFVGEVFMAADPSDIQKRASSMRTHVGKAAGHLAKAVACKAEGDQHLQALHEMCKGFAMKAASDNGGGVFDAHKALEHCIAAKSAYSQVDDHHEMAAHHLEKCGENIAAPTSADGSEWNNNGQVKPGSNMTEGDVPTYDPTQPYAGKSAMGLLLWKTQEAAYLKGKVEALERMPAAPAGQRPAAFDLTKLGTGKDSSAQAQIMEGVVLSDDPDVRQKSAARMIGNIITGGHGKNPMFDPNFRGAAGA
jgi:hypothetical protein